MSGLVPAPSKDLVARVELTFPVPLDEALNLVNHFDAIEYLMQMLDEVARGQRATVIVYHLLEDGVRSELNVQEFNEY